MGRDDQKTSNQILYSIKIRIKTPSACVSVPARYNQILYSIKIRIKTQSHFYDF